MHSSPGSCGSTRRLAALLLGAATWAAACKNQVKGTRPNEARPLQQAPVYSAPQALPSIAPTIVETPANTMAAPAKDNPLANYDAILGARLARNAKSGVAGGSLGQCFAYVARAISEIWPNGFHDSGDCSKTDLNCRTYARSFAENWKTSVHGSKMRLKAVLLKDNLNGEKHNEGVSHSEAPVGSILVWRKCSSNPAGHIAVVTKKGSESASDFLHGVDVCPTEHLIGIFVPVK